MLMMPRLAPEVQSNKKKVRFLVVGMYLAGMRTQAISDSLGILKRTVSFWLNKFQVKGAVEDARSAQVGREQSVTLLTNGYFDFDVRTGSPPQLCS